MTRLFGFLYARPSFLEGMARVMDLGNTLNEYNRTMTTQQADWLALRSDWNAVGDDLRYSLLQAEEEVRRPTHAA